MSCAAPTTTGRVRRAGFTLVEVMVTLAIVSIGLLLVTQGLTRARFTSAETHYRKVARDLALLTLGRLEAGLFWEELEGGGEVLTGSYAEEGYEGFNYELVLGEGEFLDDEPQGYGSRQEGYHDSWQAERDREERLRKKNKEDDDEEDVAEPFEKVRIKVTFPRFAEEKNSLVLERWIPWEQVYGADEKDAKNGKKTSGSTSTGKGSSGKEEEK